MSLEFNNSEPISMQASSDNSFTEVDFNINEDPFEIFHQKREIEDVKAILHDMISAVETESTSVVNEMFITDSSNRLHIRTPQSGPALLTAQSIKYQKSNIVSHLSDL